MGAGSQQRVRSGRRSGGESAGNRLNTKLKEVCAAPSINKRRHEETQEEEPDECGHEELEGHADEDEELEGDEELDDQMDMVYNEHLECAGSCHMGARWLALDKRPHDAHQHGGPACANHQQATPGLANAAHQQQHHCAQHHHHARHHQAAWKEQQQQLLRHRPTCALLHNNAARLRPQPTGATRDKTRQVLPQQQVGRLKLKPGQLEASKFLLLEYPDRARPGRQASHEPPGRQASHEPPGARAAEVRCARGAAKSMGLELAAASEAAKTSGAGERRATTTVRFVSQLYFLIHLSAMISLLLHHKNLVSNEYRSAIQQQQLMTTMMGSSSNSDELYAASATKRSANQSRRAGQKQQAAELDEGKWRMLPEPQMFRQDGRSGQFEWAHASPAPGSSRPHRATRSMGANESLGQQYDAQSADILVRLLGRLHARRALQYFLCYLLASSMAILVLLWLLRACTQSERAGARLATRPDAWNKCGRQDCTPVLIGSISLGLIQLIVIGLDIADNVDWLASSGATGELARQWPILLPFLQFSFVSLLMQFILAQVAKNRSSISGGGSGGARQQEASRGALALARRKRRTAKRLERRLRLSDNAQNIALAHLLVTHILLWLMRLNSISLFQTNEPQVFLAHSAPPAAPIAPSAQPPILSDNSDDRAASQRDLAKVSLTNVEKVAQNNGTGETNEQPSERRLANATRNFQAPDSKSNSMPLPTREPAGASPKNVSLLEQIQLRDHDEPKLIGRRPAANQSEHDAMRNERELRSTSERKLLRLDGKLAGPHVPTRDDGAAVADDQAHGGGARAADERHGSSSGAGGERDSASASASLSTQKARGIHLSRSPPPPPLPIPSRPAGASTTTSSPAPSSITGEPHAPTVAPSVSTTSTTRRPVELKEANVMANVFRSSLPKRMTAFRQSRPSQRQSNSTTAAPAHSSAAPPSAPPSSTTTRAPASGSSQRPPASARKEHKVRVLVSREDEDNDDAAIDLTAVIPATSKPKLLEGKLEPTTTTTMTPSSVTRRPQPATTSERPFPSVETDPPAARLLDDEPTEAHDHKASASSAQAPVERRLEAPPGGSSKARARGDSTDLTKRKWLDAAGSGADSEANGSDAGDPPEDEEEPAQGGTGSELVDLDALLPPVPNYDEDEPSKPSSGATSEPGELDPRDTEENPDEEQEADGRDRKPRSKADERTRQARRNSALLDEEPFVFNEAASSQHNLTNSDKGAPLAAVTRLALVGVERLAARQRRERDAGWRQQPTFTEFLLPIVQQYHILVLAILFNMWLDSMHSERKPAEPAGQLVGATSAAPMVRPSDSLSPLASPASQLDAGSSSRNSGAARIVLSLGQELDQEAFYLRQAPSSLQSPDQLASSAASSSPSSSSSPRSMADEQPAGRRLFWYDKRRRSQARRRLLLTSGGGAGLANLGRFGQPGRVEEDRIGQWASAQRHQMAPGNPGSSSVCSVFFGLLVVSGSLIVILLGVDLLSLVTQCAIQLVAILVCLVGLCYVWRLRRSLRVAASTAAARSRWMAAARACHWSAGGEEAAAAAANVEALHDKRARRQEPAGRKSSFHYLFLMAAYYCGVSISLNLGQQYQLARLFPHQVIRFVQRNLSAGQRARHHEPAEEAAEMLNYQLLFHALLIFKGLVLILQVTVQTILIRSSWSWSLGRTELRQLYNFLMFANLSLWALEICDQQQQLQLMKQHSPPAGQLEPAGDNFELLTLEGFTRFAGSVVTLSHLYHGLVFMQH